MTDSSPSGPVPECSTIDIAPTISKLLAVPMVVPTGRPLSSVEVLAEKHGCKRVVVLIIDSLGYSLYERFTPIMENTRKLAEKGLLFKCRSEASHTSPAIASIFTGYRPEEHRIYSTGAIYRERDKDPENPRLRSILEWGARAGRKAAVVIEAEGAETFRGILGKNGEIYGVSDSEDILAYDREIAKAAVRALGHGPDILAVHLRALDRFSHRAESWDELKTAAKAVDENVGKIVSGAGKDTLIFLCGDHTIHGSEKWLKMATEEEQKNHLDNFVALIVSFS